MRADICDPSDEAAVERFRGVLRALCATKRESGWDIGVTVYRMRIGPEELFVFSDSWSIDIEGPDGLVQRVVAEYAETA